MNRIARVLITLAALLIAICTGSVRSPESVLTAAAVLPSGFVDDVVLGGLTKPTAVRFSPDGRIFVAEKSGIIKVFESLSDSSPTVFADLRTSVHNYWDRGLLSMALDPGFPARPYVYVLYTYDGSIGGLAPAWGVPGVTSDGCPDPPGGTTLGCVVSGRVSRLQAAGNVMTGPETVLVHDWFQQFPGHSIGDLLFGPDGALYVSGGEGASFQFVDYGQVENPGGDPPVAAGALQTAPTAQGGSLRSQDLETPNDSTTLDGTVIRINPANGAALSDNPLYARSDPNARRIVAYGFRNPFRLAIRPGTRELWVGDVGWRTYEEINVIPDPRAAPVRNFGWPCFEGNARQSGWDAAGLDICEALYARAGATTAPFFSYKEGSAVAAGETCPNTSSSITGLAFYTGASYPTRYKGALFFADYTRRCVWVMFADAGGRPDPATRATFVQSAEYPVDLQTGPNGDLFYVNFSGGNIHRIRYSPADRAPQAVIQASPTSGAPPLTVKFDGSQSSDPEGSPVTYSWDLNADGTFGDSIAAAPTYTYGAAGTYRAGLRVQDGGGLTGSASVTISVGNTPPSAIIDTPSSTLRWRVGQSIGFSGRGVDAQQASLPASALSWDLIMNHCSAPASCHEHPIQSYQGTASGTFVAPDHEYPSFLTLRLTATDAGGLESVTTRRLDPQTVTVSLRSSPSGAQIGFGGETPVTPAERTAIVGSAISLSAPAPQVIQGSSYSFGTWSDGGAQTHIVVAPGVSTTYTATFRQGGGSPDERVLIASRAPVRRGTWRVVSDPSAAGGARLEHPDAGAAKIATAAASPRDYVELYFHAEAGKAYRLWFRGKAAQNSYANDSVFVQFSLSLDESGAPRYRIGTTDATTLIVEACKGCGVSGWGWEDNMYGGSGPLIRFARSGLQTMRIQGREDGVSIDQFVLSPVAYLTTSPGLAKNDGTVLAGRTGLSLDAVLHASSGSTVHGAWKVIADATAAGGARLENTEAARPKLNEALSSPADYFDLVFHAEAGRPYRLWLRGSAYKDSYNNDSVFVQFSGAVTAAKTPVFRIGSSDAAAVVLEDCNACGLAGWGWQDNGYGAGVLGPEIYFAATGLQRIRIQRREDGLSIDQVVISGNTYLSRSPGTTKNDAVRLRRNQ